MAKSLSFLRPPRPLHLLLLFIFLAFGLRLYNLDAFSFWTDEGLTPLRASYPVTEILSNRITIQEGITRDTHPPFFYLIIHFSRTLFGQTDFAYRYPSLLTGILLVPLLFQLGRRLQGRSLGLAAALLAAVNPLQIYYANEARMYTLLVLLAAAASYILWRALQSAGVRGSKGAGVISHPFTHAPAHPYLSLRSYLLIYVCLAGLAFYTHYTAAFLILTQAPFWAWLLWRRGQRRLLLGAAAIGALVAIPLLPFTIPRLFTGAEANYSYVSPLVMLQDVVRFFNLGVTVNFDRPDITLLNAGALALMVAGLYAAGTCLRRAFLLVYLLAAVLGLMAGSLLIKPMYQGVRHIMIGSPAFLLLLAWGLVWLWQRAVNSKQYSVNSGQWAVVSQQRPLFTAYCLLLTAYCPLALLGTAVVLLGPAVSLDNLYHNVRYAKDDFRSLVAFVEQHAGGHDVVIYNNAVLLPLHRHYQARPDIDVTAVPVYPYHATHVGQQLGDLAQQYDRIWFVTDPPADGRDDNGLVRRWLDEHLAVAGSYLFAARTTEVRAIVYATAAPAVATLPENARPLNVQWADLPALAGLQLKFDQPAALPALWLELFWRSYPMPAADTHLRFTLRGPDDGEWLRHEQALAAKGDTSRFEEGLSRRSYHLPLPVGMPPGVYTIWLEPITAGGIPLGEARPLAEIELAATNQWPVVAELPVARQPLTSLHFDNGLSLKAIELLDTHVRPGHTLPLVLYWQAGEETSLAGVRYELEVVAADGSVLRTNVSSPGAPWLPAWPAATPIREKTGLYFQPETEPGRYRLRWRLLDEGAAIPGRPSWRPWSGERVYWGEVQVEPWPLVTDLPVGVNVVEAQFGPAITLYGYDLARPAGDSLQLTLYWRAQAVPAAEYFTFVHLVAPDGAIVSQRDYFPLDGLRRTPSWRAGEVLADAYALSLPEDLAPGDYTLRVGLYEPDTFARPPVTYQGQPQPDNLLVLTTVRLP